MPLYLCECIQLKLREDQKNLYPDSNLFYFIRLTLMLKIYSLKNFQISLLFS